MPPHTPKFPPITGARAFMADIDPIRRSPYTNPLSKMAILEKYWTYPRRITGSFDAVPDTSAHGAHRKCSAKVVEDYPWTVSLV